MTENITQNNNLVLAIVPSSKGFGYAILEGDQKLVNWGVKTVTGEIDAGTTKRAKEMMIHYKPDTLVLHNAAAKVSRRGPRIRNLTKKLIAMAARRKMKVTLFSREQVRQAFSIDGKGTRHMIAKILAGRFPEELGHRLPRKRKAWEGEDTRMKMFDAVALAITKQLRKKK